MDIQKYKELIHLILKNGIKEFESQNIVSFKNKKSKKGSIAAFTSKQNMLKSNGFIFNSEESLIKNSDSFTHWTPNVYSYLGYGENSVYGHSEKNLIQINTFVVDIDFPFGKNQCTLEYLILVLLEENLLPTLILRTDKGYQCYFSIQNFNEENACYDKASFISNANNFKSLQVAKRISKNIKLAVKSRIKETDLTCNDFGVFRFPSLKNIVHFEPNFVDTFEGYLKWSKKFEEKNRLSKVTLLKNQNKKFKKQVESSWFNFLLNKDIQKGDRNTVIFTLALACKSSNMSFDECMDLLDLKNFSEELSFREVSKTVKSAFSNKYLGASSHFINDLLEKYASESELNHLRIDTNKCTKNLKGNRVDPFFWYKFAKKREDRKYSHFDESTEDLLAFLEKEQTKLASDSYFVTTQISDISENTGISISSLKVILKRLVKEKVILLKSKRGRSGFTCLVTKTFFNAKLLKDIIFNKKTKIHYASNLFAAIVEKFNLELIFKLGRKNIPFKIDEELDRSRILDDDGDLLNYGT